MNQFQPNTQFSVFPPAVKHLLIINVLFFVARMTPGIDQYLMAFLALWPVQAGIGLFPGDPMIFYPWQLVSYMFLHGGMSHVFFNLFALWIFGQSIENVWGTRRFAWYYILTGIGAGLLHLFVNLGVDPVMTSQGLRYIPTLGASGAVYGILLAFAYMFPNREIFLIFLPIPIKAKYFVIIFGGLDFIAGVSGMQTGVAHFAHLGGMLAGYILIKYWGIRRGDL
ncbi:MAG: rhomboid family intramembrane serine protease [Balneolales bacterium]